MKNKGILALFLCFALAGQTQAALIGHWDMDDGTGSTIAADSSGTGNTGTLTDMDPNTDWVTGKIGTGALDFDGTDDYVNVADSASLDVVDDFTIAAWVKATVGSTYFFSRHNSANWKGYNLGVNADGKVSARMYITANSDVRSSSTVNDGNWYHVALVVEAGQQHKLYVDGSEPAYEAQDIGESGTYAGANPLRIGRHCTSATSCFNGTLDEVRFYSTALSENDIYQLFLEGGYESPYEEADLNEDGYVDFYDLAYLVKYWLDTCPTPDDCEGADMSPEGGDGTVNFKDFALLASQWSPYNLPDPYPADSMTPIYKRAASYILIHTGITNRGYCLVFGAGQGRLAYQLAVHSDFKVIGVDTDSNNINSGRTILHNADIYGDGITLQPGSLDSLNYRDYAAVLVTSDSIISDGTCSGSASEMYRMIRPDGGMAIIGQPTGCPNSLSRTELENWLNTDPNINYSITEDSSGLWARIDRGPLPGAGEWTHQWADLGNTGCSGDTRTTDIRKVLWFGEPGPRIMPDRHLRSASPLYNAGKLITPGKDHIVCSDAYNGARLWDLSIPKFSRGRILSDAGGVAMDDDYLYVAAEENCFKVDLDSGEVADTFSVPGSNRDWGYMAIDGDLLFGSEQYCGASKLVCEEFQSGDSIWWTRRDNRPVVTSRALFCRDRDTGELLWKYDDSNGLGGNQFVIVNPTICVGSDVNAVYFFESYDATSVAEPNGNVHLADFTNGNNEYLVKLDKNTGEVLQRKQHNLPYRHIIYLSYANDIVLANGSTGSSPYYYHYYAYYASSCDLKWQQLDLPGGSENNSTHGVQDRHAMIVGDTIYRTCYNITTAKSYDLQTGSQVDFTVQTRGCTDCTASMNHIFTRLPDGCVVGGYNLSGDGSALPLCSEMRPGCYINIIPAGGIIMLPACSAGCSCNYTIQTSIGWLPVSE